MRKPPQIYNLEIPDDDYKMAAVMERDKVNFESPNIWFYVGADSRDPSFVKVGITMGDLRSRSYSSANPNYHLFCAFQCYHHTTKSQLESIETGALAYLDDLFPNHRARHWESQHLSECYYNIDFEKFFSCLHDYLLDNHHRNFQTAAFENEIGVEEGYALAWEFNPRLSPKVKSRFRSLILRY
ncbi:hypothetical protein ACET8R_15100 [Aeromonas veronii]